MPKIIEFLGYCPLNLDESRGRRLYWARYCNGLSQSTMAQAIGVDPNPLSRLENGRWEGREKNLMKTVSFLEAEAERQANGSG